MGFRFRLYALLLVNLAVLSPTVFGQLGNAGSIEGEVKDPSGASVNNATVELTYAVTGFTRTTTTDSDGAFRFTNVPFNPFDQMRPGQVHLV